MILQFAQAAELLESLNWFSAPNEVANLARNALRGSLYEQKFRGAFDDYPKELMPAARQRAIQRLRALPKIAPPIDHGMPLFMIPSESKGGWGTYKWKGSPSLVEMAIRHGASLIDTAETYGYGKVERELGKALMTLGKGLCRETLIATKLSRSHMSPNAVRNAGLRSLNALGRIDLYQIHWPSAKIPIAETLGGMQDLFTQRVMGAIGVCNFSLDQLWAAQRVYPNLATLQLRCAPEDREALVQEILPYCREAHIVVIGHSPFGQGAAIGSRRDTLRWCRAQGIVPIPGTNNVEHLKENLSV